MQVSFNMPRNNQVRSTARSQKSVYGQKAESLLDKSIMAAEENKQNSKNQSDGIDAWIEKNRDKDFGMLMGGGVSTDKPLNWDADGTSKLTGEQIDYLRSTYDLSDMSKQDYYDLMADLTNMNAISIKDVISQHVKPMVPGVVRTSVSQGDTERGFGHFNMYGNVQGNLLQYIRDLNYMSEQLTNGHSTMDSLTFFAFKEYLNDEKAMAGRLESIFNLIAR